MSLQGCQDSDEPSLRLLAFHHPGNQQAGNLCGRFRNRREPLQPNSNALVMLLKQTLQKPCSASSCAEAQQFQESTHSFELQTSSFLNPKLGPRTDDHVASDRLSMMLESSAARSRHSIFLGDLQGGMGMVFGACMSLYSYKDIKAWSLKRSWIWALARRGHMPENFWIEQTPAS